MHLTRSLLVVLLAATLGLSACAGGSMMATDSYHTPRAGDLPVGIDEGLITRDWDGGHPFRLFAFILNPAGIVADLIWNQPSYMLASQDPELFGYTNQDETYRQRFSKYRYSWSTLSEKLAEK